MREDVIARILDHKNADIQRLEAENARLKNEIHEWEESDKAGPVFTDIIDQLTRERDEALVIVAAAREYNDSCLADNWHTREGQLRTAKAGREMKLALLPPTPVSEREATAKGCNCGPSVTFGYLLHDPDCPANRGCTQPTPVSGEPT